MVGTLMLGYFQRLWLSDSVRLLRRGRLVGCEGLVCVSEVRVIKGLKTQATHVVMAGGGPMATAILLEHVGSRVDSTFGSGRAAGDQACHGC